jgi:hypothetical protein
MRITVPHASLRLVTTKSLVSTSVRIKVTTTVTRIVESRQETAQTVNYIRGPPYGVL